MNLANFFSDAGKLRDEITNWSLAALPNLIAALLILIVGWWIAGRVAGATAALLARQGRIDDTLSTVLTKLVRYVVLTIVAVASLSQLGVETTSILAALGAIGLAVGLALQNTLSNIAAGVMLLWLRPFGLGDFIEYHGGSGKVADIGLFATRLTTVEGLYVFVPNSELWNKKIVNYSRGPNRMVRETFTISYNDDIAKARGVLLGLLSSDSRIHKSPEPVVKVDALGDSSVELEVRAWTGTADYLATRWDVIEQAKTQLEAEGISIPYPQQDVHIRHLPEASNGSGGGLIPVSEGSA